MNDAAIRDQYELLKPMLNAWGSFVVSTIRERLTTELIRRGDHRKIDDFLKIPAKHRVKDTTSFVAKALHRGKNYRDPFTDIVDMVGARFVVLLSSETVMLDAILEAAPEWQFSKDRDFERARVDRPQLFDYESNHYIVRNERAREHEGVVVPAETACEVQIRTLLQHAYAELSHDRLYKPECQVPDRVRRLVARGSALLETTDHVFCEVSNTIGDALQALQAAHAAAIAACATNNVPLTGTTSDVTFRLLEQFAQLVTEITPASLQELMHKRDYVPSKMRERSNTSVLFSHPAGLISYWLVDRLEGAIVERWPFDRLLLEQIAADLGISLFA